MLSLKSKLEKRLEDQFFSSKVKTSLDILTTYVKQKFVSEAKKVYIKTINYLEKIFNFENSPFKYFSLINFKNENFKFQDF